MTLAIEGYFSLRNWTFDFDLDLYVVMKLWMEIVAKFLCSETPLDYFNVVSHFKLKFIVKLFFDIQIFHYICLELLDPLNIYTHLYIYHSIVMQLFP